LFFFFPPSSTTFPPDFTERPPFCFSWLFYISSTFVFFLALPHLFFLPKKKGCSYPTCFLVGLFPLQAVFFSIFPPPPSFSLVPPPHLVHPEPPGPFSPIVDRKNATSQNPCSGNRHLLPILFVFSRTVLQPPLLSTPFPSPETPLLILLSP